MPVGDEDIERLNRTYDLFNAEEFDALAEFISPDVVIEIDGPNPPLRGWAELRAFWEPAAFEWQRLEPESESYEVRGDKVLVRVRVVSKGAASGIEVSAMGWNVWTERDGLVVHMLTTADEAKARELFES